MNKNKTWSAVEMCHDMSPLVTGCLFYPASTPWGRRPAQVCKLYCSLNTSYVIYFFANMMVERERLNAFHCMTAQNWSEFPLQPTVASNSDKM